MDPCSSRKALSICATREHRCHRAASFQNPQRVFGIPAAFLSETRHRRSIDLLFLRACNRPDRLIDENRYSACFPSLRSKKYLKFHGVERHQGYLRVWITGNKRMRVGNNRVWTATLGAENIFPVHKYFSAEMQNSLAYLRGRACLRANAAKRISFARRNV